MLKFSVSVTFEIESNHNETISEETLSNEIQSGVSEALEGWTHTYGGAIKNLSFDIENETMTPEELQYHRYEAIILAIIGIPLFGWILWKDFLPMLRRLFSF